MSSERRDRCVAMSRVVGLQWIGNAVVILLAILWLQIPDSHTWQFCFLHGGCGWDCVVVCVAYYGYVSSTSSFGSCGSDVA